MTICVFGAASKKVENIYIEQCESICHKLALEGYDLIFGAGSTGLMGAAARGFKKGGAKVHGVIPKFFEENGYEGIFYESDEITYTDTMAERKTKMEDGADAFLITPGGIGTFEELFEVLTLKQLGRHKKAIVIYNENGYYSGFQRMVDGLISAGFVNDECKQLYKVFDTEEEVINYIKNYSSEDIKWDRLKKT